MNSRYFLVLLVLLATACKKNETPSQLTSDKNAPAELAKELTPAEIEEKKIKAAEMAKAARVKAELEAAATRLAEAKEKHASLNSEFKNAIKEYSTTLRNAKTKEARTAAMEANPVKELGKKFVSFAKEYEGTDQAYEALELMTLHGLGDSKTEAMTMLLEIIEANPEDSRAHKTLSLIAMRGSGEPNQTRCQNSWRPPNRNRTPRSPIKRFR